MRAALVLILIGVVGCAETSHGDDVDAAVEAMDAMVPDARPFVPMVDAGPPPPVEMYVHTADTLYTIDDTNFELHLVGTFDNDDPITDLAVTPDGTLYGISKTALYTLSPDTGAATYVAEVPGLTNVGMTFLRDGTLLATDDDGGVRKINPHTGTVIEVGEFGGGYATAGDLVAVADGTMYAISDKGPDGDEHDNNVLLTVDVTTGVATPVGKMSFGGVFGCAYTNGKVYAFTRNGEVVEIDRMTGSGTLVKTHALQFWGAGVTPLVEVE